MSWIDKILGHDKQDNAERIQAFIDNYVHVVKSDLIDDTYYWYDRDSNTFICQGQSDEEIRSNLQDFWQGHIFVINDHMLVGPQFDQLIKL